MKYVLTALALVFFSIPAIAGTTKTVWNQSVDSPANVAGNAKVTSERSGVCSGTDDCRRQNGPADRAERRGESEEKEWAR